MAFSHSSAPPRSCFKYIDLPVSLARLADDSLSTSDGRKIVKSDKAWLRRQRWQSYLKQAKTDEERNMQNAAILERFPAFTDDERSNLLSQEIHDSRESPPGSEQSSLSHSETTKSGLSELSSATASTRISTGVEERRRNLLQDAKRRFNPMFLDVEPDADLKVALEAVTERSLSAEDDPVGCALCTLRTAMQTDRTKPAQARATRSEEAVADFAEAIRVALAEEGKGFTWLGNVRFVSQGTIPVKSSILSDGKQDEDKPDLICVQVDNEEHGHHQRALRRIVSQRGATLAKSKTRDREVYDWSSIRGVIEVRLNVAADMSEDTESQLLLRAHSFMQEHRRTTQLHLLSVCGIRVRLWTIDPLCYRTSPVYSLDKKEDLTTIAGFFALMASPWAYSEWSLGAIGLEDEVVKAANGAQIAWELLPGSTRTSLFGRKTACWSTPVKDSRRSLILKAAWLAPHLQEHEGKVLDIVCRVARDKQRESLPDLAVMVKPGYAVCRPWLDDQKSDAEGAQSLSLVLIITRHYLGETIVYNSELRSQRHFLHLYLELYQTLFDLAEANVHYRDLNAGNVLRRRGVLDALCFHDFDRARIGMQARGDQGLRLAPFGTAVDDARSATGWFAPTAFERCKQWQADLHQLQVDRDEAGKPIPSASLRRSDKTLAEQIEMIDNDITQVKWHLRTGQHRFVDDIESALYLQLYQIVKGGGNSKSSLRILEQTLLANPLVKLQKWENPLAFASVLRQRAEVNDRFRNLLKELRKVVYDTRQTMSESVLEAV